MDLSTLISPLLNLASAIKTCGTSMNRGNQATAFGVLDRTLGTVGFLGLTFSLLRVLKQLRDEQSKERTGGDRSNTGGMLKSIQSIVHVLLRSIFMGMGIKRIKMNSSKKDEDEADAKWAQKTQIHTFTGSCHCQSVSFILRAPRRIEAKECDGKIKYPHCISSANDFQLLSGSKFLSNYYVDLCNVDDADMHNQEQFECRHVTAAHTFCNRCGVHILRAPNSLTNKLEVNTSCLDDFRKDRNGFDDFLSINVTIDNGKDWMGMSEGKPVQKQLNTDNSKLDDDYESIARRQYKDSSMSPWSTRSTTFEKEFDNSNYISQSHTPVTVNSTIVSGSCLSSTTNDSDSTSDGISCDGNLGSPLITDYSLRHDESVSISGWPIASSLQSLTPKIQKGTSRASASLGSKVSPQPSSMMKDQLKYYMKKHMSSTSRMENTQLILDRATRDN